MLANGYCNYSTIKHFQTRLKTTGIQEKPKNFTWNCLINGNNLLCQKNFPSINWIISFHLQHGVNLQTINFRKIFFLITANLNSHLLKANTSQKWTNQTISSFHLPRKSNGFIQKWYIKLKKTKTVLSVKSFVWNGIVYTWLFTW